MELAGYSRVMEIEKEYLKKVLNIQDISANAYSLLVRKFRSQPKALDKHF